MRAAGMDRVVRLLLELDVEPVGPAERVGTAPKDGMKPWGKVSERGLPQAG